MTDFNNRILLITGGTGSFGHTVLKHFLYTDIGQIRIFSRDEKKQDDMRHELQARQPNVADKADIPNPFYLSVRVCSNLSTKGISISKSLSLIRETDSCILLTCAG